MDVLYPTSGSASEAPKASPRHSVVPIGSLAPVMRKETGRARRLASVVGITVPVVGFFVSSLALGIWEYRHPVPTFAWNLIVVGMASISFAVLLALISFLPSLLMSRRDRAMHSVVWWAGAREIRRLYGAASQAMRVPLNPAQSKRWLVRDSGDRRLDPLRVEVLLMDGRYQDARAVAAGLPRSTPYESYRAEEMAVLAVEQETGAFDESVLRGALERVPPGDDHADAAANLAVFMARRASRDGDWRTPLLAARSEIVDPDLLIHIRDGGWPSFVINMRGGFVPFAIVVFAIASLLSVLQIRM